MDNVWEQLAHVTATELGFVAVRWWQDPHKPHLLCIEAHHRVGEDSIRVIFTTFLPEYGPPVVTIIASTPLEPGAQ